MKNELRKQLCKITALMEQDYRIPPELDDDSFLTNDDYHDRLFSIYADADFSRIPKDVTFLTIKGSGKADLSVLCDLQRLEVVNLSKANVHVPDCLIQKDAAGELLLIR